MKTGTKFRNLIKKGFILSETNFYFQSQEQQKDSSEIKTGASASATENVQQQQCVSEIKNDKCAFGGSRIAAGAEGNASTSSYEFQPKNLRYFDFGFNTVADKQTINEIFRKDKIIKNYSF